MERAISEMERIKRAEEIYSRRNNLKINNQEGAKVKSIYKTLFQILLLVNIAIIIVAIQNKDYIFTQDFINIINGYNVNIKTMIEQLLTDKTINSDETNMIIPVENNESVVDQETSSSEGQTAEPQGALVENEEKELTQMEQDAEVIKNNYSVILPLNGTKTSSFGQRNSNNSIVTSNHTGIDLAAPKGTVIKSAISGKVTQVSNQGDYGNHLRISTDKLTILYAHCSKIYVSEGDEIIQGQDVAEVGSTGNSTGPHLHFEIRYEDRFVNPELVLGIL